ncbi:MAG: sulfotransferase domain-containing protein [Bacteroidia bacterium]|nr:sulfotransferase domain-containing protein [Bacteroidia bacterium]
MNTSYPNLFVPGAGKSGTSALHEYLDQHPKIGMSSKKEPHYWTRLDFESLSQEQHQTYLSLFPDKSELEFKGESSTGYMLFPNFIERIQHQYSEVPKFIFLLRNPIDRCYSHYWWLRGMGSEKLPFKEAVLADFDVEPSPKTKLAEANYKSYFQYGLYAKWLERFYTAFGKEKIKIICSEDLREDPLETLNDCFSFLGLEALDEIQRMDANPTVIHKHPFLFKWAKRIAFDQANIPDFLKRITPKAFKQKIKKDLIPTVEKYSSSDMSYPEINQEDRNWLGQLYADDVKKLKALTTLEFRRWRDFN